MILLLFSDSYGGRLLSFPVVTPMRVKSRKKKADLLTEFKKLKFTPMSELEPWYMMDK